jgi:fatty acid desaturase
MIRRVTDRMILWLIAAVILWALLAQPAFTKLGHELEAKYSTTDRAHCADADRNRGRC